jgi:hypothetical protein
MNQALNYLYVIFEERIEIVTGNPANVRLCALTEYFSINTYFLLDGRELFSASCGRVECAH